MAEQLFRIPLTNIPQEFSIELAGRAVRIESRWNGDMPAWLLDIYDDETSEPLIISLPLVTGADLLSQHRHIGMPGQLIAYTDGDEFAPPTLDNLGQEAQLYYIVDVP